MRVLVTGGGGFVGGAIVRRLVERGERVASLSRGFYRSLDALGVRQHRVDLSDSEGVRRAFDSVEAVIHTAAKAGVWGARHEYVRANIDGTRSVINACRGTGVGRLVYTSTPSVVHVGGDIDGADESLPYTTEPSTAYQETKTVAEREVIAAASDELRVIALRPHLVWGPGDPHLVPRIIARGRRGQIALPGGGRKRIDTVYVDNVADAHVAALDKLSESDELSGRAYFITNDEPVPLREIVLGILRAASIDARVVAIPPALARLAGAGMERLWRAARIDSEPPLTRFVAEQLSTAHHFSIAGAKRDLQYAPQVSLAEGLERLAASLDSSG